MKRSEVIKLMIERAKYHDGNHLNPYGASKILEELLEIGMLPPINNSLYHLDGDHANIKNTIYRTWEPEDE